MPVKFPVKYPIGGLRSVETRQKIGKLGDPDPLGILGIYRVRHYNGKKYQEKITFYPFIITHTPAQQAMRLKYRNGFLAWQALTVEQKEVYNVRARGRHFSGYNLFMKEYLLA